VVVATRTVGGAGASFLAWASERIDAANAARAVGGVAVAAVPSAAEVAPAKESAAAPSKEPVAPSRMAELRNTLVRPVAVAALKPLALPARSLSVVRRARRARGPRVREPVRRARRGVARTRAAAAAPLRRRAGAVARLRRRFRATGRGAAAIAAAVTVAGTAIIGFATGADGGDGSSRQRVADVRAQPAAQPAELRARASTPGVVIQDLLSGRVLARHRLARAANADDQAAAARSLQVLFRDAARRLSSTGSPALQRDLVTALRSTDAAYGRLAVAIRAGDPRGYDEARAAVISGESTVLRAAAPLV
jgi:hypothetical protein